ncbi:MAG: hypothetical protein LBH35_09395, partial [Treponema sp.]|nr:hypothetical protein [Treponema sp.]
MKLTYQSFACKQRDKILADYPALAGSVCALERIITEKPEAGREVPTLSGSGKTILCKQKSVRLNFFAERYAIGYSRLT